MQETARNKYDQTSEQCALKYFSDLGREDNTMHGNCTCQQIATNMFE